MTKPTVPRAKRDVSVAVLAALRELARRAPVVLAIDDVQWLDGATAKVLAYALRRLENEPVGVLASCRSGDTSPFELDSRIELQGLSLGALHHIVRDRLGVELHRPLLARLTTASGGNPFFALEIVCACSSGVGSKTPPVHSPFRRACASSSPSASRIWHRRHAMVVIVYALAHPTPALVEQASEHRAV